MKSFVSYPFDFEKMLYLQQDGKSISDKIIVYFDLYKMVSHIKGSIVKCGIASEESFTKFAMFRKSIAREVTQKVVAFEKFTRSMYYDNCDHENGALIYKFKKPVININYLQETLKKKGIAEKIDFVPGNPVDSIPEYLIENPELKISYLNINFDDYDTSLTALEFFYPRLVDGGILILDNYYKKDDDYKAVSDYFKYFNVIINNFSVSKGPHYIVKS